MRSSLASRSLLLALAALLAAGPARAADPAALAAAARALQAGVDQSDAALLRKARARFAALSAAEPGSASLHLWVAVADWRLVPALPRSAAREAERFCRDGLEHCRLALAAAPEQAPSLALEAGLQGLLLTWEPGSMMTLGPEIDANLIRARALAPADPRVWLLDGMSTLHKPASYGGGPAPALAKLLRAAALFDSAAVADSSALSWGRDDAYLWAGRAALQQRDTTAARALFAKALGVNPRNRWVRDLLLPSVGEGAPGTRP